MTIFRNMLCKGCTLQEMIAKMSGCMVIMAPQAVLHADDKVQKHALTHLEGFTVLGGPVNDGLQLLLVWRLGSR